MLTSKNERSRHKSDLRLFLKENLEKHVSRSESRDKGDTVSFTEYQKAEEALLEKYGRPAFRLSRDTLESIRQEVQDEVFAESRKLVEEQLVTLRSETSKYADLYQACRTLSYNLFRPWYQQERYYSADYFAKNGGTQLLVDLIQSGENMHMVLVSMSACWNFCSDDKRSRLLIQNGILPAIDPLLKKGDLWVKAKCIGLLWGLVEFPDIQVSVVCPSHDPSICHM